MGIQIVCLEECPDTWRPVFSANPVLYTSINSIFSLNDIPGVLFDGVSMPIRNLKPAELALFLVSFYQRGIRRVHLLGTSNFETITICAYAARNMFEWVSLDSTSWRLAADHAEFISPLNLSRIILRSENQVPASLINDMPLSPLPRPKFYRHSGYYALQRSGSTDKAAQLAGF